MKNHRTGTAVKSIKTTPVNTRRRVIPAAQLAPTQKRTVTRKAVAAEVRHIHVLDTNVLMHDPQSLFRFEEHDVYIPLEVLEELDKHKKGHEEIARNSRTASRTLDAIFSSETIDMKKGMSLVDASDGLATGNLFIQTTVDFSFAEQAGTADNRILFFVQQLTKEHIGRKVILVSNDTNMRIKARALGISAQDYKSDKVIEDVDMLYSGVVDLPIDFWETHEANMASGKDSNGEWYKISGPLAKKFIINQFVRSTHGNPFHAQVVAVDKKSFTLRIVKNYHSGKNKVWGITARNDEQNYVLNLLLNPEIDFVSIVGKAGSGKTLLTLAAALEQTLEQKRYSEIIFTRITVPVGEDIGFLPGTEEEKMNPWMGALDDNLEVLGVPPERSTKDNGLHGVAKVEDNWNRAATRDLIRSRIKVKSLSFMRGRTFLNKFVIIDEAQNLTPKQIKTLVTRAGPGTKIVCLGNLAQIDTPYLTEGSSGLTYLVEGFKGWEHGGHITLLAGERSRLANHANEVLN